eukprot:SAG31_NODE_1857_length_7062_cov_6.624587_2_plen_82_part_00
MDSHRCLPGPILVSLSPRAALTGHEARHGARCRTGWLKRSEGLSVLLMVAFFWTARISTTAPVTLVCLRVHANIDCPAQVT